MMLDRFSDGNEKGEIGAVPYGSGLLRSMPQRGSHESALNEVENPDPTGSLRLNAAAQGFRGALRLPLEWLCV